MKWYQLLFAVCLPLAMIWIPFSAAIRYSEMAKSYREASSDETTSPQQRSEKRIYAEIYFSLSMALNYTVIISMSIISSAIMAFRAIHASADARIRALQEELNQLRTLVSGNRP